MSSGSCSCGAIVISFTGEPIAKAVCHCNACKKSSGSAFTTNIIIPGNNFKLDKGSPKTFSVKADSGNDVVHHFCGECGCKMWRDGKTFGEDKVVQVGILDGPTAFVDAKPGVELFAPQRISWIQQLSFAEQKPGMP